MIKTDVQYGSLPRLAKRPPGLVCLVRRDKDIVVRAQQEAAGYNLTVSSSNDTRPDRKKKRVKVAGGKTEENQK